MLPRDGFLLVERIDSLKDIRVPWLTLVSCEPALCWVLGGQGVCQEGGVVVEDAEVAREIFDLDID